MTEPEQAAPSSVRTMLRPRPWRRTLGAIGLTLALGIPVLVVAGDQGVLAGTAPAVGAVPAVPKGVVSLLVDGAKSCSVLTVPRLAAQAMAAPGLDMEVPIGLAGINAVSDAVWKVWAPWEGPPESGAGTSIQGLARLTCDLVGYLHAAAMPGDPWRLAVAASQTGLQAVVRARGVPMVARAYVDRVATYAAAYAQQTDLAAPVVVVRTYPQVGPPPRNTTGFDSVSIGRVVGKDGKCLHVDSNRNAYRAPVQISRCDGSAGQTWTWSTDGTMRVLGYCLSSVGHALQNGSWLQLDRCAGAPDQVWNSSYTHALYNTDSSLCLDVPGGNTTDGTQLRIWVCNRSGAQSWSLAPGAITENVHSRITSGACLEVGGQNSAGGQVVRLGTCSGRSNQQWTIGVDGKLRSGGLCLEVIGQTETSAGAPGTAVDVNTCVGTRSQTWAPQPDGSLQNPVSHLCLTAPLAGATLQIEKCVDGIYRQQWTLPVRE